jgi:sulfopyruvate decarboxylase TPP-binding subunit
MGQNPKLEAIKITEEQKRILDKLKVHPRQPYHEVLQQILELITISTFTKKEREENIKNIKHLRSIVVKRMGTKK